MKIALVGASGRSGQAFINRALKENYSIKALARDPKKIPQTSENLQVLKGDVLNPDDVNMLVENTNGYLRKLFFDAKMKKYVRNQCVTMEHSHSYVTEEQRRIRAYFSSKLFFYNCLFAQKDSFRRYPNVVVSLIGHVQGSPKWLQTDGIKNLILAMKLHSVDRIISLTGGGVRYEKDRPKLIDSLFKGALKIFAASVLRDAISHTNILKESNLEWTIVRVPMLTDGPSRGDYRVGWVGVNAGMRISRADVADFIVWEIENKKYVREMPFLSY